MTIVIYDHHIFKVQPPKLQLSKSFPSSRFRKGKILLLIATACWIIFTEPIGHIHPPVVSCKYWNGTNYLVSMS